MTDADSHRPNSKYKLSKPDNPADTRAEEPLTFYYNRERRLAKAPQAVKDLYTKKVDSRFNLIRPLIADKPRAILFFTIILMVASVFLLSILGYLDNSYSLDGNKLEITGIKFEDMVIVVLKKTWKKAGYTGAVDIAVSPVVTDGNENFPVFYHRVFFSLEPLEEYRFAVPFDSPELLMVLQTEKSTLNLKIKPK